MQPDLCSRIYAAGFMLSDHLAALQANRRSSIGESDGVGTEFDVNNTAPYVPFVSLAESDGSVVVVAGKALSDRCQDEE